MYPSRTVERWPARPLGRRAFLRATVLASAAGGAFAVACGRGDDGDAAPTATAAGGRPPAQTAGAAGRITPAILTSEFVAGEDNRFAVGLLDAENRLVKGADVYARFFTIGADGSTGTLRGESQMNYAELDVEGAHLHDASTGEDAAIDSVSFYLLNTPFDVAGRWGVEISVTPQSGEPAMIQAPFDVLAAPNTPAIGTLPPASANDTAATNADPASLCSRDPACPLHEHVIADVLGKGRPLVVQFSTPAFCETRFCGPVLEVLLQQEPAYRDRIDFVHIEVWQDIRLRRYRPAMAEWNLKTEPFTFFMASDGRVVGKLEAIFSEEELASALDQLVRL